MMMMMHDEEDDENMDEVMLPGFRFHPTDEELVGFYLRRKILHKPLSIELIKQIDIYKYDPWDLPKLSVTGEKEWYFYCPRDRKYRNSARPNRVTGSGFWKATGTDRPIYSSHSSKCIGLKKSLVFYKGRAAKGIKTDWMMHEFRLPRDSTSMKKYLENNIPPNEAWAICRIFKKASSNTQRALSNSWISPVHGNNAVCDDVASKNVIQFGFHKDKLEEQQTSIATFSPLQSFLQMENRAFQVLPHELHPISSCTTNVVPSDPDDATDSTPPFLLDVPASLFGGFLKGSDSESVDFSTFSEPCRGLSGMETMMLKEQESDDRLGAMRSMEFCYGYPPLNSPGAWKSDLVWGSSSPCPSEVSSSYTTNKCYS